MIKHSKKLVASFFLSLIVVYKKIISPLLPHACRFTPTCSEYMFQAIKAHGICKGIFLGVRRILRCNPWGNSGFDPVPPVKNENLSDKATD